MAELNLYREISIDGVNGRALVKVGSPVEIEFPDQEIFFKQAAPVLAIAWTEAVKQNAKKWEVLANKFGEICIIMDPTISTAKRDEWVKQNGGITLETGHILSPVPLPDRFLLYSVAYVDSTGNITPSPLACREHNWPDRMKINEAYSW